VELSGAVIGRGSWQCAVISRISYDSDAGSGLCFSCFSTLSTSAPAYRSDLLVKPRHTIYIPYGRCGEEHSIETAKSHDALAPVTVTPKDHC